MSQSWVRFCDDVIPNTWNPALVGRRCKGPPKPALFGSVPFIRCVNGPESLQCFGRNRPRRRTTSWSPRKPARASRRRYYRSCSPRRPRPLSARGFRSCSPGPKTARSPRSKWRAETSATNHMRVPTECDAHILHHMRCSCSACMRFACRWRRALKREFKNQMKQPLVPPCKPQRWASVLGRKLSPVRGRIFQKDCRPFNYRLAKSPPRGREPGPHRSPKVSWWFGNYRPSSEADSNEVQPGAGTLPQSFKRKSRREFYRGNGRSESSDVSGFSDVAMDGTSLKASRLFDHGLGRPCEDPVCQDCVSRCGAPPSEETTLVTERPRTTRRRRPLVQGIASHSPPLQRDQLDQTEYGTYRARGGASRSSSYSPHWQGDTTQNRSTTYPSRAGHVLNYNMSSANVSRYEPSTRLNSSSPWGNPESISKMLDESGNKRQLSNLHFSSPVRNSYPYLGNTQYGGGSSLPLGRETRSPYVSPINTNHLITSPLKPSFLKDWPLNSSPTYNKMTNSGEYLSKYLTSSSKRALPEYTTPVSQGKPANYLFSNHNAIHYSPTPHSAPLKADTVKNSYFTPSYTTPTTLEPFKQPYNITRWKSFTPPPKTYTATLISPEKARDTSANRFGSYSAGIGATATSTQYRNSGGDTPHLGDMTFNRYKEPLPYIHQSTTPNYHSLFPQYESALTSSLAEPSYQSPGKPNYELSKLMNKYCPVSSPNAGTKAPPKMHIPTAQPSPTKTDITLQQVYMPTIQVGQQTTEKSKAWNEIEEKYATHVKDSYAQPPALDTRQLYRDRAPQNVSSAFRGERAKRRYSAAWSQRKLDDNGELDKTSVDQRHLNRFQIISGSSPEGNNVYNYHSLKSAMDDSSTGENSLDWPEAQHSRYCNCKYCHQPSVPHRRSAMVSKNATYNRPNPPSMRGSAALTESNEVIDHRPSPRSSTRVTRRTRKKSSSSIGQWDSHVQQQREISASSYIIDPDHDLSDSSREMGHRRTAEEDKYELWDEEDGPRRVVLDKNLCDRRQRLRLRQEASRSRHSESSGAGGYRTHEKYSQTSYFTDNHTAMDSVIYRNHPAPGHPDNCPMVRSWHSEDMSLSGSQSIDSQRFRDPLSSGRNSKSRKPGKSGGLYNLRGEGSSITDTSQSHVELESKTSLYETSTPAHSESRNLKRNIVFHTDADTCRRHRNSRSRSRSKSTESVPRGEEEPESAQSQSTRSNSYPLTAEAKRPFWASRRVLSEARPKAEGEWLDRHVSLMSDCSQEKTDNAKSRMKRMVAKSKALQSSMDTLHLDFGNLEERLDKVKERQNIYLTHADEAVRLVKEESGRYLHHDGSRREDSDRVWTDRSINANSEEDEHALEDMINSSQETITKCVCPGQGRLKRQRHVRDVDADKGRAESLNDIEAEGTDSEVNSTSLATKGCNCSPHANHHGDLPLPPSHRKYSYDGRTKIGHGAHRSKCHGDTRDRSKDRPPPCPTRRSPRRCSGRNQNNCSRVLRTGSVSDTDRTPHGALESLPGERTSDGSGFGELEENRGTAGHHDIQSQVLGHDSCRDGSDSPAGGRGEEYLVCAGDQSPDGLTLSGFESNSEHGRSREDLAVRENGGRGGGRDRQRYVLCRLDRGQVGPGLTGGEECREMSSRVREGWGRRGVDGDRRKNEVIDDGIKSDSRVEAGGDVSWDRESERNRESDTRRRFCHDQSGNRLDSGWRGRKVEGRREDREEEDVYSKETADHSGRGQVHRVSVTGRGQGRCVGGVCRGGDIMDSPRSKSYESETGTDRDSGVKVNPNGQAGKANKVHKLSSSGQRTDQGTENERLKDSEDSGPSPCVEGAGRDYFRRENKGEHRTGHYFRTEDLRPQRRHIDSYNAESRETSDEDRHGYYQRDDVRDPQRMECAKPQDRNHRRLSLSRHNSRVGQQIKQRQRFGDLSSSDTSQRLANRERKVSKFDHSPTTSFLSIATSSSSPSRHGSSRRTPVGRVSMQAEREVTERHTTAKLLDSGCETDVSANTSTQPSVRTPRHVLPSSVRRPRRECPRVNLELPGKRYNGGKTD